VSSLHGTQTCILPLPPSGNVWKGIPRLTPETAVPSSETSFGQGEANLISPADKQPTATPFTLVVTCLLRHSCRGKLLALPGCHLREKAKRGDKREAAAVSWRKARERARWGGK